MPRERWFVAQDNKRRGPVRLAQLVEVVLRTPDPMSALVWRHGLAGWTRAGEVPEVERKISPFVPSRQPAPPVEAEPAATSGSHGAVSRTPVRERARPPVRRHEDDTASSSATIYVASSAAAVVVIAFLAFLFWPRPEPKLVSPTDAGLVLLKDGGEASPVPAVPSAGPPVDTKAAASAPPLPVSTPAATPTPAVGLGDREQNLPSSELSKLRGVAGWEGTSLVFTMYNGSSWRVTELLVRPSRMVGEQFVDDPAPRRLVPPQGEQAEAGVGSLLDKVAPDRKKPAENPFDTGRFQGEAGPRPEAYRCPIVGARGYPPRAGS